MHIDTTPVTMTNSFHVTSLEKFRDIVGDIRWDADAVPTADIDVGDWCRFYNAAGIVGFREDSGRIDTDEEAVYEALQAIVEPGDAIIITEIGTRTLEPSNALATIITQDGIDYTSLRVAAEARARKLTRNPEFVFA